MREGRGGVRIFSYLGFVKLRGTTDICLGKLLPGRHSSGVFAPETNHRSKRTNTRENVCAAYVPAVGV